MIQSDFVKLWVRFYRYLRPAVVLLVVGTLLFSSTPAVGAPSDRVRAFTREIEFDFVEWTLDALRLKLFETALGIDNYLPQQERRQLVLDYLKLVAQTQDGERQVRQIYADPTIVDPETVSAPVRQQLAKMYARLNQIGPAAESILQSQVSQVVAQTDLSLGGQPLPPVLYHSTPLPLNLVVSPRNVIRQDKSIPLDTDLSVEEQVKLEEQIDRALDVSSLVVRIGGIGTYPTMVAQTGDLNWLSSVIAHEWVHNFLMMRPLGVSYMESPELRVINETTASIAGDELGRAVIEKFYPELLPPPPAPPASPTPPTEPPAFDFRKEMRQTRTTVDQLLAEGKVEEAEQYMEARRKVFWENGYSIRKLNQAYFAFYGGYADDPWAAGVTEDPVGAAVRALRAQSPSLAAFLNRISWMTSFEQLKRAIAEAR